MWPWEPSHIRTEPSVHSRDSPGRRPQGTQTQPPGLYLLRDPGQNLPAKLLQVLPSTWRWPHSRHVMTGAAKFGEIVTWQEVTERLQAPIPVLPPLSGSLKTHLHCAWSFPPVFLAVPPKPSPTRQGPTGVGRLGPLPSGMLCSSFKPGPSTLSHRMLKICNGLRRP